MQTNSQGTTFIFVYDDDQATGGEYFGSHQEGEVSTHCQAQDSLL